MEKRKYGKKKIIPMIVFAATVVLILTYFTISSAAKPEEENTLLREYPVHRGDITAGIDGAGNLAVDAIAHNYSVPVQLDEVFVKPGDTVKKGDKLAAVSKPWLEQKLAELELRLKKAGLALNDAVNNKKIGESELSTALSPEERGNAQYQREQTQAQSGIDTLQNQANNLNQSVADTQSSIAALNTQISELDKNIAGLSGNDSQAAESEKQKNGLLEQKTELEQQLSALQSELSQVSSALESSKSALNGINTVRNTEVEQYRKEAAKADETKSYKINSYNNAVALANIEVQEIQQQIKEIRKIQQNQFLYSENDGIILDVGYTKGAETTANQPVCNIGSPEQLYARLQVSQADIDSIEIGQEVEMMFDAYPDQTFTGKVTQILSTPIKDSNPVSYLVHAAIDKGDAALLPGMTCNATLIIKQVKDILQLSNKAIKQVDGKQIVLLKDENGDLYEQPVTTGFSDGKYSEILSGLNDGDIVYVED